MSNSRYYNNLYYRAERGYRRWLALEPDNPEALFDLGQIHANSRQYAAAEKNYDEILRKSPDDPQARLVRNKARLYDNGWRIEGGFLRDYAKSSDRQVDLRLHDAYEYLEKSIWNNMSVGFRADQMDYYFSNQKSHIYRDLYKLFLRQDFLPDAFWRLGYGLSQSSAGVKDLQYRDAQVQFPLLTERLLLNLSYKRDDFIQNRSMMTSRLQEDQYRGRVQWTPIRRLVIGVDEAHSHFTDGNDLDFFGGDAGWTLLYAPNRLMVGYRWQDSRFRESMPDYFSPRNFQSHRGILEWEHSFNRTNLYWGANRFSFLLRGEYIMDPGTNRGVSGTAGINWEINKNLSLRIQAMHIYYPHSKVYEDDEQTISLIFAF